MEDRPDFFDAFCTNFGRPERYAEFSEADHERLRGRLPDSLLAVLRREGWCNFKHQSLWFCDPDQLQTVKRAWLADFPNAEIFLRTAFGDFFCWDGKMCRTCLVQSSSILYASTNVTWFLAETLAFKPFLRSIGIPARAQKSRKACGPLASDEVYVLGPGADAATEKGNLTTVLERLSSLRPIDIQPIAR